MDENSYRRAVRINATRDIIGGEPQLCVQVQVQVMGLWWAVWSEHAPNGDDAAELYITRCAEEVRDKLQESV